MSGLMQLAYYFQFVVKTLVLKIRARAAYYKLQIQFFCDTCVSPICNWIAQKPNLALRKLYDSLQGVYIFIINSQ